MTTRHTTDTERNALKTAYKRLLALVGGIDAAATVTRVARSVLYDYGVPQLADRHVPVDVLMDLERVAGTPVVTEALAGAQGYLLLPITVGEGDVADALGRVSQSAGKTLSDGLQALRDGLPDAERAVLTADLVELNRIVSHTLGLLRPEAISGPISSAVSMTAGRRGHV
jgi:hypothetical protein